MKILQTLRKPYLAMMLSSLVLFVSCSQYDDAAEKEVYNKSNRILTDDEITEIGINHNLSLTKLFSDNPQNLSDVTKKALELHSEKGLTEEVLNDYFNTIDKMDTQFLVDLIEEHKSSFVNSQLLQQKIIEIENVNSIAKLKAHEESTRNQLEGIDLDLYLVLTTVYQHSLEFWNNHVSQNEELSKRAAAEGPGDWKKADGITASIGFLTYALVVAAISGVGIATGGTGIVPTVSLVASLLGIGFSSALASIYAFIGI